MAGDSVVMAGVDDGPGSGPGWRWDVALSFAGAQRAYVEQVATVLKAHGVRCFYDADEQIELWGKYLAEELPTIYGEQAAAVVMFVSADYAARDWTTRERRAALTRAARERREYVLPARFDDTLLPGLPPDMVTVDLRTRSPQQFAAMIVGKLAALAIAVPGSSATAGDPAQPETEKRATLASDDTHSALSERASRVAWDQDGGSSIHQDPESARDSYVAGRDVNIYLPGSTPVRGSLIAHQLSAHDATAGNRGERVDDRGYRNMCLGYLRWAAHDWRFIHLGNLGTESGAGDIERLRRLPLQEMYVSLQVDPRSVADRRREEQLRRMDEADRVAAAAYSLSLSDDPSRERGRAAGGAANWDNAEQTADDGLAQYGLSPEEALAQHQVLVVLGHPGSGKSVMCEWLGSRLAWQELEKLETEDSAPPRIPMKFRAADYAQYYASQFPAGDQPGSLGAFLANSLLPSALKDIGYTPGRLEGMFDRALSDGHAVLLIDGLDELSEYRNEVIDALAALVNDHIVDNDFGNSQAVITSRIEGYSDIYLTSGEAAHYLIRPMSREQISGFVTRFFSAIEEPDQAQLFLEQLEGSDSTNMRRLASTPLSLTSMCTYWYQHSKFPPNEAMLYRRLILDTSFWWRGFAAEDESPFLDGLVGDEGAFLGMLSSVAVRIHEDHIDGQMTEAELLDTLDSALHGLARLTGADPRAESGRLISRIKHKVGILAEFSPGKFRFLHQVYREYLVGYDLLNRPTGVHRDDKPSDEAIFLRLKDRVGDPRWRQPILLALAECGSTTRTTLMSIAINSPGLDLEEWVDILLEAALARLPAGADAHEIAKLLEFIAVAYDSIRGLPDVLDDLDARMAGLRSHVGPDVFDSLALSLLADSDVAAAPIAALYSRRIWLTADVLAAFAAVAQRDSATWGWPIHRALRRAVAPRPLREVTIQQRLDIPPPDDSEPGRAALRLFEIGLHPWEQQRRRALQAVIETPPNGVFSVRQAFLDHPEWWEACFSGEDSDNNALALCAIFGGLDHHDCLRWISEDEDFGRLVRMPAGPRGVEAERRAAELAPRFGAADLVVTMADMVDTASGRVSATTPTPVIDPMWMTCPSTPVVRSAVLRWLSHQPGDPVLLRQELELLAQAQDRPEDRAEAELALMVLDGRPMTPDATSVRVLGRALETASDAMIRGHRSWFAAVWASRVTATGAERAAMHRFLLEVVFQVAGRPMALAPAPLALPDDSDAPDPVLQADNLARQLLARSWGKSQPADLGLSQLLPEQLLTVLGWLTTLPYQSLPHQPGGSDSALWHEAGGFSGMALAGLTPFLWPLLTWAHRQDPQLGPQLSEAVHALLSAEAPTSSEMPLVPQHRSVRSRQSTVDLSQLERIRVRAEQAPGPDTPLACLLTMLSHRAPEQEKQMWRVAALELLARERDQEYLAETLGRIRRHLGDDPAFQEGARELLGGIGSPMLRADAAGHLGRAAESLIELVGAEVSQAARVSLLITARVLQELSRVQSQVRDLASDGQAAPNRHLAGELDREPVLSEPWFLLLDEAFLASMTVMIDSDPTADETLTQLLPLVSRIDDQVVPDLMALLERAAPGARWPEIVRNLLALRRAAAPGGYAGMFRDLVEMVMTGDAATSARAYLQLLGPYGDSGRATRHYKLSEYGLDRWWELGTEVVAETDPKRSRLLRGALHEWDIDVAAAVGKAARRGRRSSANREVWLRLLRTGSIWREGPQRTLATWLDGQPPDPSLATACLDLVAMLLTATNGLPVVGELQTAAVLACTRAGSIPRAVPDLFSSHWRLGVARAVADACLDAMRADVGDAALLDAAMANLRSSTAPVITIDSAGMARADLPGYGNLQWINLHALPDDAARFVPADLNGEQAMRLLAAWADKLGAQDRADALDSATYEAVLSMLVVLSARDDDAQFMAACPPESMQRVLSDAVLSGSDLCAVAGLTLLSRLRFVNLVPADGPGLMEVLDFALRGHPKVYAAALAFVRNVRYVGGASIVRAICEQIEQSPNEAVAQGFAGLAAVHLTSPACSTADVRRLREALRADIGEKAQRCAVHLVGTGTSGSPIMAVRGPDRQSEFRRLRRQARSSSRGAGIRDDDVARLGEGEMLPAATPDSEQLQNAIMIPVSMPPAKSNKDGLVAHLTKERGGDLVYLVRGKDGGRPAWHYVLVDVVKVAAFKEKLRGGSLDVSEYGKILYSGWGKDPPEEIDKAIKEEYG